MFATLLLLLFSSSSLAATSLLSHLHVGLCTHVKNMTARRELAGVLQEVAKWRIELPLVIRTVTMDIYANQPVIQPLVDAIDWPEHTEVAVHILPDLQGWELADAYKPEFKRLLTDNRSAKPSTWIVLEDDMVVSSQALLAWAHDTMLFRQVGLAQYGFQRSFLRYEQTNEGQNVLIDPQFGINKTRFLWNCSLDLPCQPAERDRSWCAAFPFVAIRVHDNKVRVFMLLENPYCAISVITNMHALHWLRSPFADKYDWKKYGPYIYALRATASFGMMMTTTGYPEFWGWDKNAMRALVPLDEHHNILSMRAGIYHSSNNYWSRFVGKQVTAENWLLCPPP